MINVLNQIALNWWEWMGSMFWQVSLLIIVIYALDALIRNWVWPQVRYALWVLVLIKLILPPSWSSQNSISSILQPVVQETINDQFPGFAGDIARKQMPAGITVPSPSDVTPVTRDSEKRADKQMPLAVKSAATKAALKANWQVFAMAAWIAGMLVFVTILTIRIKRLRQWHRQQKERKTIPVWFHDLLMQTSKRLKMQRLPAIVFSDQAVTPAVYGIFHPVLLFPADYFDNLSRKEAEHVLLHELSHIKRGDLFLHGLTLALQIVYWFNPLLLWVRKHMKHIREICCDLTVANILREKTKEYRQTLVDTARELLTESVEPGMGLLGVFEEPFRLVARLKWLEKTTWQNYWLKIATAFMVVIVMVIFILPMAKVNYAMEEPATITAININKENDNSDIKIPAGYQVLDIAIKRAEPLYAAALHKVGSTDEFEAAVEELRRLMQEADIKPTGYPFGRFFSNPDDTPEHQSSWQVGYPVKPDTEVKPPLEIIRVANRQVAYAAISGIKDTESVWQRFIDQLKGMGYIPAFPPAVEIWTGEEEKFWSNTELQIEVFRPDQGYPGLESTIKEIAPMTAIVLPMQGSHAQHPQAQARLDEYIRTNKIKTTGPQFGRYFSDPSKVPPQLYIWEVGYPVKNEIEVEAPFEVRHIEETKVASAIMQGPHEYEYPWGVLIIQMILKGYIPSGPAMEIWSGDPTKTGPHGPNVEMQIPVIELANLGEDMKEWGESFGKQFVPESRDELQVSYKEMQPMLALVLPMKGSFDQHEKAIDKLSTYIKRNNIKAAGEMFGRYLNNPREVEEADLIWEVGVPIAKRIEVAAPLKIKTIPGQYVASTKVFSKYETLYKCWALFITEILEQDAVPTGVGMEIWHEYDRESTAPETELRMPVVRDNRGRSTLKIDYKKMDEFIAVVLPMRGSYQQLQSAIKHLRQELNSQTIAPNGHPFVRGFNDPDIVSEEELLWEIGYPVSSQSKVKSPLQLKTISAIDVASTTMEGLLDHVPVWQAFVEKVIKQGHAPSHPTMYIWHTDIDQIGKSFYDTEFVLALQAQQSYHWRESDQSEFALRVKESESFYAVVLPYKGPGAQIFENMHRVQQLLKRKNIRPSGPAMLRQFTPSGITPEDERLWEVGYPISRKISVEQPFKLIENPSTLVGYCYITGKFDEDEFNKKGARWIYENGYWPNGGALIFCPDKFYNDWMTHEKWEFQIPLEKVTKSYPQVEIFTKWAEPIVALVLPMKGSTDHDQEAYQKLQAYLSENNIIPTGDPFYRFFSDPNVFPLDEIIWEVGIAVPKGTGAKLPFEIKYIPEQLVAYSTVKCEYEDIEIHWKAFGLLAQSMGYFMTGAPMRFMKNGKFEGICVNEFRHPIRRMRHTSQTLPIF
jgi:beta-lactamase regulating signal transducer with metallopeptidase domain/effector-binding domain-containing protein